MRSKKQMILLFLLLSLLTLGELISLEEVTAKILQQQVGENNTDGLPSDEGSGDNDDDNDDDEDDDEDDDDDDNEISEEELTNASDEDNSVTEEKKRVESLSKEEKEKALNSLINNGTKVKGEGGSYTVHGDILVYPGDEEKMFVKGSGKTKESSKGDTDKRDVTAFEYRLWPDGILPYKIQRWSIGFESRTKSRIFMAMDEIERKSCVRFRKANKGDEKFVEFRGYGGCASSLGRQDVSHGRRQVINMAPGCDYRSIAVHEILHALGFYHEQERPDRDTYVRILWDNIRPGFSDQFELTNTSYAQTLDQPYDFKSVMHYKNDGFGKTGPDGEKLQTIEKIGNPNANFGQPLHGGLSKIDQRQLNILYCEGKKLGVVKDELETTSRHALEEYEGSSWREFGAMLKSRLSKIYEDYWFTVMQLGKNVAKRNFAFQHNGNCIGPISQFGRTLVVCWVRKDSFIRATQHGTAIRVYRTVRKAVRDIETCDVSLLAEAGYSVARINKWKIPVSSVFIVREQSFQAWDERNRFLHKAKCGTNRVGRYYMVMYFGR